MMVMFSLKFALVVFLGASQILAAPSRPQALEKRQNNQKGNESAQALCDEGSRLRRRSWHSLSDDEKHEYLNAELCLQYRMRDTSVSKYDELIKVHQSQAGYIHGDGWFFPWHRLHMHAHETLLRQECGYTGAQPYWDETIDAGSFTTSILLNPETGFGGNGVSTAANGRSGASGCVMNGRFANYTLRIGPGYSNVPHCLSRSINNYQSRGSTQTNIDNCLSLDTFAHAWPCLEGLPHLGGHNGIGGVMANAISSPGDPLFFLHHTFLDRLWWQWQEVNLEKRLSEIAGYTSQSRPSSGWVNATLDDELNMFNIIPSAKIRDLMDIRGQLLCYEYE